MTISSQIRKAGPFSGDGIAVDFPFSFKVFDDSDLLVVSLDTATSVETTLTLTTDYSVTLNSNQNANPGGTVTLVTPLAVGTDLVLASSLSYLQPTELRNQGGFYPSVITDALDRLTILVQQLKEEVDRSAKVPITSSADAQTLVDNINNLATQFGGITTVATSYQTLSGTGAQVDFTLTAAPASLGAVEVYVAGLNKIPGTDFTVNGTTLSFTVAPASGTDNIFVRWISAQATTTIDDGSVTTAKLAASAVTAAKIAAGAVATSRLANGAVTSAKLDSGGVTLPAGSTVQVPDYTDSSAKPAPTSWIKGLTASETRAGISELGTAAEYNTGTDPDRVLTLKVARDNNIVLSASQATTSGTSKIFSDYPAWAKEITVSFDQVSTNGTSPKMIRIGDAGGMENTNYKSATVFLLNGAGIAGTNYTDGFSLGGSSAADVINGSVTLRHIGGNTWSITGVIGFSSGAAVAIVGGTKTLSNTLTQIEFTSQGGTDTFDLGKVSSTYR